MISSVSNTSLQPAFRAPPVKSDVAASGTAADAPANPPAANPQAANSQAANSQSAQKSAPKPQTPPQQTKAVLVESTHTRNTDGTYGPKHTLRPPAGFTPAAAAGAPSANIATSGVNIKV